MSNSKYAVEHYGGDRVGLVIRRLIETLNAGMIAKDVRREKARAEASRFNPPKNAVKVINPKVLVYLRMHPGATNADVMMNLRVTRLTVVAARNALMAEIVRRDYEQA